MSGSSEKDVRVVRANKPSLPIPEERPLLEMELWDRNDVGCWLLSNGGFFVHLVHQLHHNTIDGQLLLKLNKSILQREYGLSDHEADIFLIRLKEDKRIVKEEVNHINKVDLERCDSKEEGVTSIVHEWSYEEVCLWLLSTGGEKLKLIDRFYLNQINGTQLLTVTAKDLSAWGYANADIKSFLWWRDYIAINGYSFKESFNKLFTRSRNSRIARDEPFTDTDSVYDGSDSSSIAEADSFDSFASNETNDPSCVSFDVKRMETDDGVDIVVGAHREERATEDGVDNVLGELERRETEGDVDIVVGGRSVELVTGREPDISLGIIPSDIPTSLLATDEPNAHSTGGNATVGEIIHIGAAPSRFDAYLEKELKAIREAVDETSCEIIDVSPAPSRMVVDMKLKAAPEMEKHIESVQKIPSAVRKRKAKETQGEIIHLSAVPSRFDAYAQKELNSIREASQTPGEDVPTLQQCAQHQVNLEKQLECAQKIPPIRKRKQAEQVQDQFYKSPEPGSLKQGVQHRNQTQSNRQSATHEAKQENQVTQVQRQVQSVQKSQSAFRNRKQKHQVQIQEQNFTRRELDEHREREIQSSDIQTSSQNQQQARRRSQSDSANQFQKQRDLDHNVEQGRQQKLADEPPKKDDQFSQARSLQETRIVNPLQQTIRSSKQFERNEQVLNQDPTKQRKLQLQPEQEDQQRCLLPSNRCMQQARFGKRQIQNHFTENAEKALSTQEQADCLQPVDIPVTEQSEQCLSSQYQIRLDSHRSQSRDLQIQDGPHPHSQVAQHQRKESFYLQQPGSRYRFVQEQTDTQQQKRFVLDPHTQNFDRNFLQQKVPIAPDPCQAFQRFQAPQFQQLLSEEQIDSPEERKRFENPLPEEREQFRNPLPEERERFENPLQKERERFRNPLREERERFGNPLPEERERFRNPLPEERFVQSLFQLTLFHQSVEQDYLFCIQNQSTATWVLFTIIAYAAANLDQKESSKTPGGFGMREMVQVA